MQTYHLMYVMHSPSEESGGMYMAEVPVLPGCQAWADTPDEALRILSSVAREFIASYKEHGDDLPAEVTAPEARRICVAG